jgi:hypothetical protein
MMEEMLEKLEELIARAERFEEIFEKKVESLAASEEVLLKLKKSLTLEVEELRKARHAVESSLTKKIENAIEKNINAALPKIMPQLIGEFVKKTESLSNAAVKNAISLNDILNTTINRAGHLIEDKKNMMTWRKAGLTFTFCFSSVLTALCINYFYPQYTHLKFDITPSMVKFSLLGEVAAEMYEKEFTQKQKDKMHEGLEKKYRASLAGPPK